MDRLCGSPLLRRMFAGEDFGIEFVIEIVDELLAPRGVRSTHRGIDSDYGPFSLVASGSSSWTIPTVKEIST
jgi:hypothetical protein